MVSESSHVTILDLTVGEKLTRDNWILWKAQFLSVVCGAQLMHYLKEDTTVPSTQITILTDENKEAKVSNPDYTIWVAQDQRDLSYLLNLITK
jgi:hypothetical protein